jgi:3-dehydroquinate synthetase
MKELASELKKYRNVFIVCDRKVEGFARSLDFARDDRRAILPITADEAHKNIGTVMDICQWLMVNGADRDALVLAAGGGVTTDMAGFAASIYKRGIRYANVPTTLLSMVDAGIGGKTGVNLDGFKNLLGVIRQPEFTAIFPEVLETLPERELRSGLAEMLKTFIIKNPAHAYERTVDLFRNPVRPASCGPQASPSFFTEGELPELIRLAAGIKQDIVEKDEFETRLRRKLNLGHTWGHAIEWWQRESGNAGTGEPFTHGEAVAIGMVQAARFAEKLGFAEEEGLSARIKADLEACGLPTELPCPAKELLPAILNDKKMQDGKINLVLPVRIGKVIIRKVASEIIAGA